MLKYTSLEEQLFVLSCVQEFHLAEWNTHTQRTQAAGRGCRVSAKPVDVLVLIWLKGNGTVATS